jgi:sulfite reductase beta subunit-like hemoprotein
MQLVAISDELTKLCAVLKQNAMLSKNTGVLLKRQTARMNALLLEHGIEKLPDVVEENALLVEQNIILLDQRETDLKTLLRLQEKLDAIHASYTDAGHKSSTAQAGAG